MKLITHTDALNRVVSNFKNNHLSIGFVPTMGALHEGHLSLVEMAKKQCNISIVSVFVNPTQFNSKSDLSSYPSNIEKDKFLLEQSQCDILFFPSVSEIYPNGEIKNTYFLNGLDKMYEGAKRPGHFDGVCTIVHRLLSLTKADKAYFGQKDFQQLAIVKQLVHQTKLKTQIIEAPTKREHDGLAMSSRNQLLNPQQRKIAPTIYQALVEAKQSYGRLKIDDIIHKVKSRMNTHKEIKLDYVDIVDAQNLKPIKTFDPKVKAYMLIAVFLGKVRLIDNLALND